MYQHMLFKDMLPEYIPCYSRDHKEFPLRFQVCSTNGDQQQFVINVAEDQDPESIALEALGYFVVPEISIPHE